MISITRRLTLLLKAKTNLSSNIGREEERNYKRIRATFVIQITPCKSK